MPKSGSNGYSILIVDDDPAIRDIYSTSFTEAGFIVYAAKDGVEGLAAAKENHPSLVLLDLMMPKMDGREMLKRMKQDDSLKQIPVIVFSALITELEKQDSIAAGATDYIEKSDIESPDQLVEKARHILNIQA